MRTLEAFKAHCRFGKIDIAEEHQTLAAAGDQVPRRQAAAFEIVAADAAIQLPGQLRAPDDDREVVGRQFVELIVMTPLADHDDAVSATTADQLADGMQFIGIDARQQHVVAAIGDRVGQAAEHAQEERLGHMLPRAAVVRHHDGDRAVLL